MSGADRAINFPLRVQGIGDVERDFKRAGDAGSKSFSQVAKSANGAAREISDYHARLKRVATAARAEAANLPDLNKGNALTSARNRNAFVLDRVRGEQGRIRSGMPDLTLPGAAEGAREAGLFSAALRGVGGAAGIAGIGLAAAGGVVLTSMAEYQAHERALISFNATLAMSGNASNAHADEIAQMAARVSDATLQTEEATLKAAASLARVPGITADVLDQAIDSSARFADAMETDVAATAEKTGAILTALAKKDLKALVTATDDLAEPLQKMILDLAQAGKTAEAQQVYLKALSDAAGSGPTGLATAADGAGEAWKRLKTSIGSMTSGPAESVLNAIAASLDFVRGKAHLLGAALDSVLTRQVKVDLTGGAPTGPSMPTAMAGRAFGLFNAASGRSPLGMASLAFGSAPRWTAADSKALAAQKAAILNPDKPSKGRGGGGGGGKGEADKLAREAEQARNAADRVAESNDKVLESYRERAEQASELLGLEGAALEAVERRHEIDAAVNRLSRDEIEKTVEARRAEAAAARQAFDATKALADATAAFEAKRAQARRDAENEYDDKKAREDNVKQLEMAQAIYERTRTPQERIKSELASSTDAFRNERINADTYARDVQRLAEAWVDAGGRIRNEWTGLGDEISGSLGEIIVRGGDAKEILKGLLESVALRVFDATAGNPLADWIDGMTGNSREKSVEEAKANLLGGAFDRVGVNADLAASALARVAGLDAPIAGLTDEASAAAKGLGDITAGAGKFGSTLSQILASLSSGGGGSGGGGLIGSLISLATSALAGGGAGGTPGTAGGMDLRGFAGGGRPPAGMPFWVGENGRELMMFDGGGGAQVIGNDRARGMSGVGGVGSVHVTVSGARGNAEIEAMVRAGVKGGLTEYDRNVGARVQNNMARRGQ